MLSLARPLIDTVSWNYRSPTVTSYSCQDQGKEWPFDWLDNPIRISKCVPSWVTGASDLSIVHTLLLVRQSERVGGMERVRERVDQRGGLRLLSWLHAFSSLDQSTLIRIGSWWVHFPFEIYFSESIFLLFLARKRQALSKAARDNLSSTLETYSYLKWDSTESMKWFILCDLSSTKNRKNEWIRCDHVLLFIRISTSPIKSIFFIIFYFEGKRSPYCTWHFDRVQVNSMKHIPTSQSKCITVIF